MSSSMPNTVLMKVLRKFDKDSEVKINKTPRGTYRVPKDGYYWSFSGLIEGVESKLKLDRRADGKYVLVRTTTQVVEEIVHRHIKSTEEEQL